MSEKYYHLHLISDSTGETINVVAKAVCARFVGATAIEHGLLVVKDYSSAKKHATKQEKNHDIVRKKHDMTKKSKKWNTPRIFQFPPKESNFKIKT